MKKNKVGRPKNPSHVTNEWWNTFSHHIAVQGLDKQDLVALLEGQVEDFDNVFVDNVPFDIKYNHARASRKAVLMEKLFDIARNDSHRDQLKAIQNLISYEEYLRKVDQPVEAIANNGRPTGLRFDALPEPAKPIIINTNSSKIIVDSLEEDSSDDYNDILEGDIPTVAEYIEAKNVVHRDE